MTNFKNLIFNSLFFSSIFLAISCNSDQKEEKALQNFQEKKAAQLKENVSISNIKNPSKIDGFLLVIKPIYYQIETLSFGATYIESPSLISKAW